jgi:hypothetical protein
MITRLMVQGEISASSLNFHRHQENLRESLLQVKHLSMILLQMYLLALLALNHLTFLA